MANKRTTCRSEALDLIRQAGEILQEEKTVLASSDDCDYFRAIYRTSKEAPRPQPSPPIAPAIPPAAPSPLPEKDDRDSRKESTDLNLRKADILEIATNVLHVSEIEKQAVLSKDERTSKIEVSRHLPKMSKEEGFAEIQKILSRSVPDLAIVREIPSDAEARSIAERWKTKNQSVPISLLFFHEPEPQRQFLTNLAQALDVQFGQARLIAAEGIEKESQWEAFLSVPEIKLIIICDYVLWQMPNLLKFYREVPSTSQRFLLNAPLMLLPDLTLYLKDPLLKRSLWRALCQKIAAH